MDSADSYLPRVASRRIETALSDTPVVLVVGPRQAGKSTLVRQFSGPERPYLTLDDETVRESARFDPSGFVRQRELAIIDEVQQAPELLNACRLGKRSCPSALARQVKGLSCSSPGEGIQNQ